MDGANSGGGLSNRREKKSSGRAWRPVMLMSMFAVVVMLFLYIITIMPKLSHDEGSALPESSKTNADVTRRTLHGSKPEASASEGPGKWYAQYSNGVGTEREPAATYKANAADVCERMAQIMESKVDEASKRVEEMVLASYSNILSHVQDGVDASSRTKSELKLVERAVLRLLEGVAPQELVAPKLTSDPEEFVDRVCFKLEDCPTPDCKCPKLEDVLEEQRVRLEEECQSKPPVQVVNCPPCPDGTLSRSKRETQAGAPDAPSSSSSDAVVTIFDNDLASPSATDPSTPRLLVPSKPRGVFYVVVGAENSGNRYLVSMLAAANCMAVSGHAQPWDVPGNKFSEVDVEKLLQKQPACAGVHRSFPHNGLWIDLRSLLFQILSVDYEPRVIYVTRNILAVARSQINNNLAASKNQAFKRINKAKREIYGYIANTQVWFREIEYEQLAHRKYLEYIYEELGYEGKEGEKIPPAHKYFRNANLKYRIEDP